MKTLYYEIIENFLQTFCRLKLGWISNFPVSLPIKISNYKGLYYLQKRMKWLELIEKQLTSLVTLVLPVADWAKHYIRCFAGNYGYRKTTQRSSRWICLQHNYDFLVVGFIFKKRNLEISDNKLTSFSKR